MDKNLFTDKLRERLHHIYNEFPYTDTEFGSLLSLIERVRIQPGSSMEKWNEQDIILICYGDSIRKKGMKSLPVLHEFLKSQMQEAVNYVHILPFYPYSSDDGFSVIDYRQVDPGLGDWDDISALGKDYRLMFDLVINHISQHSTWFQNYLADQEPGRGFFIEADPGTDLSKVVRPRSLPLLTAFETSKGTRHVWTTFSADQIDLNFSNPKVLMEMMKVFIFYLSQGAKIIRLDAIAFLWKEPGTSCLHLPQTHEVVKLMRDIADHIDPRIILLTETNVPNKENLSYFGKGDEASMVYQFSLPPLLLHALYKADSSYLSSWASSLSEIPRGCTFFNFTASHDGIGVRPLEGLIPKEEVLMLAGAMKASGGHISTKRNSDGTDSPYEMNITYLDALTNTAKGQDNLKIDRFIASQTLMMSFRGIPAFYIHSLLGTPNYYEGVKQTGMPRSINRRKWERDELEKQLAADGMQGKILKELLRRIAIRKQQKAFHPEAAQSVIQEEKELFILCRGDKEKVWVVANLSDQPLRLEHVAKSWLQDLSTDLLSGEKQIGNGWKLAPYQVRWLVK
ncbi:MAG: hypothetical protein JW801_02875 [Bacteroidales bacterium]|nr:hypothetical protein [Bacteroidales bacterium]